MKKLLDSSARASPLTPIAGRRFVALGIAVVVLFAASLPGLEYFALPARTVSQQTRHTEFPTETSMAATARASAEAEAHSTAVTDESLTVYVAQKYGPLIESSFHPAALTEAFYDTLFERERIAVVLNTSRQAADPAVRAQIPEQEQELAQRDDEFRRLLHPTDFATFEILKDSDVEQFQLSDYADGIANVAPLDEPSRHAVLLTKLQYRRDFRSALLESGILRGDLSPADRRAAFDAVRIAFEHYTSGYLQEVRQYLRDDAQYALLSNYETTEFAAELEKLRVIAYDD